MHKSDHAANGPIIHSPEVVVKEPQSPALALAEIILGRPIQDESQPQNEAEELTHYFVVGPERATFEGGEFEPPEYGHDVCCVEAASKREAIAKAVKHPDMADYVETMRGDGLPPFMGLKAEDAECPHGRCFCDKCREQCPICEAESEEPEC